MSKETEISTEVNNVEKSMGQVLKNRSDDYEYGREAIYFAAEKLQDILEIAVENAHETGHPRAIEVATNTANSLAMAGQSLIDHQLKTKKLNDETSSQHGEINKTTNNLNVNMKASDLLELFKKDT
jgi:hypothetical protein